MTTTVRTNLAAREYVQRREDFTNRGRSLSGRWHDPDNLGDLGVLPDDHREALFGAVRHGGRVYIVRSYDTPIAWWTPVGGWHAPAQRYSQTTTGHQDAVRRWADIPRPDYRTEGPRTRITDDPRSPFGPGGIAHGMYG